MACYQLPNRYVHPAYPSPALSSGCSSVMADWQPNPEDDPQHPFNLLYPIDTQLQTQCHFQLPPQHVLDYLSPPLPPSPYTPQSVHSPTPPQLERAESFDSNYLSPQNAIFPPQSGFWPQQPQHTFTQQEYPQAYSPAQSRSQALPLAQTLPSQPLASERKQKSRGRAVCIGINYFNQKGEMRGRVDEARNLSSYLQQVKHYTPESIILLTDDQNGPYGQPTKQNVMAALHWLGENTYAGERLVLYYSGHGKVPAVGKKGASSKGKGKQGQQDEIETIYPVDFRSFKEGMIKPEELEELLEPVRRKGAKLTLILDAHAGVTGKKTTASPAQ